MSVEAAWGTERKRRLGARPRTDGRCEFCVWAPNHEHLQLWLGDDRPPATLERDSHGRHHAIADRASPGTRYRYQLPGGERLPDPASRSQPDGVLGDSQVIDLSFAWTDAGWRGGSLDLIYELHVGTFTSEGTLPAAIAELDRLCALGVTAIEIMPISQFPGTRNWGYDGVYPFAVQTSYGGAHGLQQLVDACHARGLAVVLDVVYNHLGPEGNFLPRYGPYFTDTYHTPWGAALNFDGPQSDGVRAFFLESARQWIEDCHVDALRLDAIQTICDRSAYPFLEELADQTAQLSQTLGRRVELIAETDANDPRVIRSRARGGHGIDSIWCDDLHHALHALLTGEHSGYYCDYGQVSHLARAWEFGMTYTGQYSEHRERRHGRAMPELEPRQIVVCAQNHDQIGNRARGERLTALLDAAHQKLAAALVLLSPYRALLFMGEEYGEPAPFLYFVSHGDPALVEAVRSGRRREFRAFGWQGELPDPQSEGTFERSRLDPALREQPRGRERLALYTALIELRGELRSPERDRALAFETPPLLWIERGPRLRMLFNLGREHVRAPLPLPPGSWKLRLGSDDPRWSSEDGTAAALPERVESKGDAQLELAPGAFAVYQRAQAETETP